MSKYRALYGRNDLVEQLLIDFVKKDRSNLVIIAAPVCESIEEYFDYAQHFVPQMEDKVFLNANIVAQGIQGDVTDKTLTLWKVRYTASYHRKKTKIESGQHFALEIDEGTFSGFAVYQDMFPGIYRRLEQKFADVNLFSRMTICLPRSR